MRDTRSHDAQGGRSTGGIHTEAQADKSAALAACSRTDHCRLEGLKAGRVRILLLMPEVLVTLPRRAYPTDLTDTQWRMLEPLIPPSSPAAADSDHTSRLLAAAPRRPGRRRRRPAQTRPQLLVRDLDRGRINALTRAAPGVFSMQHGRLPEEGSPRAFSPTALRRPASPACSSP
jgi:hypothetical protein